jgi:hypothetical protein
MVLGYPGMQASTATIFRARLDFALYCGSEHVSMLLVMNLRQWCRKSAIIPVLLASCPTRKHARNFKFLKILDFLV